MAKTEETITAIKGCHKSSPATKAKAMKTIIVLALFLVLQLIHLGCCGDGNDEVVELSERQDGCQYMWMMMNSGPSTMSLSSWLLVCLGMAAALFSTEPRGAMRET